MAIAQRSSVVQLDVPKPVDVTKPDSITQAMQHIELLHGDLDVLVNNAAIGTCQAV